MVRSKRSPSPSVTPLDKRSPKRRRSNVTKPIEVIDISSDEDEVPVSTFNRKGKAKAREPSSDIEILSSPPPFFKTDTAVSSTRKGKGKARAEPEVLDLHASSNVYEINSSEPEDNFSGEHFGGNDEAFAQGLAREWVAEDSLEWSKDRTVVDQARSSFSPSSLRTSDSIQKTKSTSGLDVSFIRLPNPETALNNFKELLNRNGSCSQCNEELLRPRGQIVFRYPVGQDEGFPPSLSPFLHAICPSKACRENHCRGCFNRVDCPPKCLGPGPGSKCVALNCCADGRAVVLYEILAAFDQQYLAEKATSEVRAQENLKSAKASGGHNSVGPGGTGYGAGDYERFHYLPIGDSRGRGRGRGRSSIHAMLTHQRVAPVAETSSNAKVAAGSYWDRTVSLALTLIRDILPAPCSDSPAIYDLIPHPSLAVLILMSYVPNVLAQLLRNDSVTDWISRSEVYHAMLALLRRMADSELIIQALVGRRYEIAQSPGLAAWMNGEGDIVWQRDGMGTIELAVPLLEHFKKLTKQSETFLWAASQQMADVDDEGFVNGLSLCGDIIAGRDDITRAMAVIGTIAPSSDNQQEMEPDPAQAIATNDSSSKAAKGRGKAKAVIHAETFETEKEYLSACEKLAFAYTSLAHESPQGLVYASYNYAQQLHGTQNSNRIPKDRLHLAKELAVMATSLPPGIWVRVDEVRNDAIKVMIAGPQGTPYAGGLFEFDVFMPLTYSNTPPLVHLRTTGQGSVRFNPNLYNNGKVCLSLLGTWPGRPEEQWSSKSTLLQVLVSIQSMILIEAPYFNEPGHGKVNLRSYTSVAYNRNIALQTVRWAMVEWLKDEHRHGIWASIIKSHFTILEEKIRKQILEWAKDNPTMHNYQSSIGNPRSHYAMPTVGTSQGLSNSVTTLGSGSLQLPPAPSISTDNFTSKRNPVPSQVANIGMDLIQEFNLRMRRLEDWNQGDD